ncbi:hypothetical protein FocTR4_00000396 [Fusarium oxysporum f. sp. cubense]|uniref:Uncharacterized protein n=1 Tax=Fusarium oxysporum f. sp. cubense TaxID=61366 RepID=A0A5C6T5M5_FUSOC|nr:hypothetical protein FocTR4_00000396 [Fusarium oxysporum f. sp. cubense]
MSSAWFAYLALQLRHAARNNIETATIDFILTRISASPLRYTYYLLLFSLSLPLSPSLSLSLPLSPSLSYKLSRSLTHFISPVLRFPHQTTTEILLPSGNLPPAATPGRRNIT